MHRNTITGIIVAAVVTIPVLVLLVNEPAAAQDRIRRPTRSPTIYTRVEIDGITIDGVELSSPITATTEVVEHQTGATDQYFQHRIGRTTYGSVTLGGALPVHGDLLAWWQHIVEGREDQRGMTIEYRTAEDVIQTVLLDNTWPEVLEFSGSTWSMVLSVERIEVD